MEASVLRRGAKCSPVLSIQPLAARGTSATCFSCLIRKHRFSNSKSSWNDSPLLHTVQGSVLRSNAGLRKRAKRSAIVCGAGGSGNGPKQSTYSTNEARVRTEVLSPFRSVRMFFYIAFMASSGIGALITLTRLAASIAIAPEASPLAEVAKSLGIDLAALLLFAFLYSRDNKAKEAQIARLSREETLGNLRMELRNKRVVSAAQMRGVARLVICAGPANHVASALEAAQPYKTQLVERGCLVVPLITEGPEAVGPSTPGEGNSETASTSGQKGYTVTLDAERRWKATPIYTNEWQKWLREQMEMAKVAPGTPVYISLRLDGRVRGSGVGSPPWQRLVAQLAPVSGSAFMDGFDGAV